MTPKEKLRKELEEKFGYTEFNHSDSNKEKTVAELKKILSELKDKEPEEDVLSDDIKVPESEEEEKSDDLGSEFNQEIKEANKKSKIKDEDRIPIMSGISGKTEIHLPSGGKPLVFNDFAKKLEVRYSDLKALYQSESHLFEDGWIIILNKEVIDEFELGDNYSSVLTPNRCEGILKKSPSDIQRILKSLNRDMKATFFSYAKRQFERKKITDIYVKESIEKALGKSLTDNSGLEDIKSIGTRYSF